MKSRKTAYRGVQGAAARAASLTPEERRAIASKAAKARWADHGKREKPVPASSPIKKSRSSRLLSIEERFELVADRKCTSITIRETGVILRRYEGVGDAPHIQLTGYLDALRDVGFIVRIEPYTKDASVPSAS